MSKTLTFSKRRKIFLLSIPPVLLLTTYIVFGSLAEMLGSTGGYLGGFLFYWIFWCSLIPLLVIGPRKIKELFKESPNRFGSPSWVGVLFLAGPIIGPFFTMFLSTIGQANIPIIVISILFAITNGTLEELLWRGTFVCVFPNSWLWSYLYPSIWFGYWHLSPQVIYPSQMPGGVLAFASISIFMGLTFGWISKKTKSIRYTTIAHILTDFMGLAGLAFIKGGY